MRLKLISLCLLVLALVPHAFAYGVLSHEELIDITWDDSIRPALLRRFPNATEDDLKRAHAYAYGGSVIQDLGYYPFGSHEFTNLLHYVRSGDFVAWMLRDARDLDEYAFAIGALSHYAADSWGHIAINDSVPVEYPKLRREFGEFITYEDDPKAHLATEFSFDVVQVAKRRYISKQYHDFIGFKVSEDLLERAFHDTYGIPMDKLLHWDDLTIETYRFTLAHVIPEMTQVALVLRKDRVREIPDKARSEFLFHMSQADYERDFGAKYRRPGIFARIIAFFLRIIPKVGALHTLRYKNPTPRTEDAYFRSMDNVVVEFRRLMRQVESGDLHIPNRNLDTGRPTRAGLYSLADTTYSQLVRQIADQHFAHVTPALKENLLEFFASGPVNLSVKQKDWKKTKLALTELKSAPTTAPTHTAGN
ncbi:MAG TPA: zinc dependent phospholipase C family protein [Terriglobales bacterium]|nr:zinc dependent phospholipase C family protein [Terriglobales bacterium]